MGCEGVMCDSLVRSIGTRSMWISTGRCIAYVLQVGVGVLFGTGFANF